MLVTYQRGLLGWSTLAILAFACDGKPDKLTGRDEEAGAGGEAPAAETAGGEGGSGGVVIAPAGGQVATSGGIAAGGRVVGTGGVATPTAGAGNSVAGTFGIPTAGAGGAGGGQNLPAPTPVVTAPQQPASLQVALGFIYFTDLAGRVRRVDPAGGQPQDIGIVPQPQGSTTPPAFVVHGASAYAAGSPAAGTFAVYELPAAGGTPVVRFGTPALASALLADDTAVYYAAQAAITRVTLSDGQPTPLAQGVPPSPALALSATHLYFALGTGEVNAVPIAGGTIVPLATQQTQPHHLLLDATNAYWLTTAGAQGVVMAAPLDGAAAAPLATSQGQALALAIGETHAYFANTGGTIQKVPLDGSTAPTPIATGQGTTKSISVDEAKVYWLSSTGLINSLPL